MESGPAMQIEFPGLFDLQVNGFAGVDFNNPLTSPEDLFHAIEAMRATGVTRFLPTLITSSFERFAKCAQTLTRNQLPEIAGIHMEGPYVCSEGGTRGAHPLEHVIAASIDDFARRQEAAGGRIRLVTLAPEVHGAMQLIEHLATSGIRVAIGHTAASPEQIHDAAKAGATLSTHLGNGCAHSLPRHPNFIWEQLANDDLFASFIVDGHHLPPATIKSMLRAKTPRRTLLVTDAVAAAGCAPGPYELNGEQVVLNKDGRVSLRGKPWLAGSSLTLSQAVANAVKFTGFPLEEILPMASSQPAKYLGIETCGQVTAEWNPAECRLTSFQISEA
ncbi:MAG TPA: amidohydrolase family protein [Candidatus Saccharimonadales bacterium]|nr:amidohydrolase family protein [Candidatus Saccharimonadales bacterium]